MLHSLHSIPDEHGKYWPQLREQRDRKTISITNNHTLHPNHHHANWWGWFYYQLRRHLLEKLDDRIFWRFFFSMVGGGIKKKHHHPHQGRKEWKKTLYYSLTETPPLLLLTVYESFNTMSLSWSVCCCGIVQVPSRCPKKHKSPRWLLDFCRMPIFRDR